MPSKKPRIYRRSKLKKVIKEQISRNTRLQTGWVVEFAYGARKPYVSGGWKTDFKPTLLVFYDEGTIIDGINLNYLPLKSMQLLLDFTDGLSLTKYAGQDMYDAVKAQFPEYLEFYRKYKKSSIRKFLILRREINET